MAKKTFNVFGNEYELTREIGLNKKALQFNVDALKELDDDDTAEQFYANQLEMINRRVKFLAEVLGFDEKKADKFDADELDLKFREVFSFLMGIDDDDEQDEDQTGEE